MPLCRSCGHWSDASVEWCTACHSPRLITHRSWDKLHIAHIDCDAFYAAVEKRDNPDLQNKPVIIGGGKRGVVSTCCYIARLSGVRSAMPMFKALSACPAAIVIKPDMAKYKAVSLQLRALMTELTPLVEPISIDEAFLDLNGTERLHHAPPAVTLVHFQNRVETSLGITVSIGLAPNKFLAKFASDLNKPRGFSIVDSDEAPALLAPLPVDRLPGIGAVGSRRLASRGLRTIGDLQGLDDRTAQLLLGDESRGLLMRAWGKDVRTVTTDHVRKSVSSERTLDVDVADQESIERHIRAAADRVGSDLRAKGLFTRRLSLKLKTGSFRLVTRSTTLPTPSCSTAVILRAVLPLLADLVDGTWYRLIGISADIAEIESPEAELALEDRDPRQLKLEKTLDSLRGRFGPKLGFGLTSPPTGKK
jgi:DNA polymerase IV